VGTGPAASAATPSPEFPHGTNPRRPIHRPRHRVPQAAHQAHTNRLDAVDEIITTVRDRIREIHQSMNNALFDQTDDPGITDLAQSLCAQCPVLARCRSWAATLDNRQLSGVVAGVVRPWEPGSRRKEAS
jgi:hypothetical protein